LSGAETTVGLSALGDEPAAARPTGCPRELTKIDQVAVERAA
jgi:hypothetical protein